MEECPIWVEVESGGVRPCPTCRPGAAAVFRSDLWFEARHGTRVKRAWETDPQARRIYFLAEGKWPTWYNAQGKAMINRPMPNDDTHETLDNRTVGMVESRYGE